MSSKNELRTLIRSHLEKIRFSYCEWDISKFFYYVSMNNEDFVCSNPQSQTVLDSADKIVEQEIWNLSLWIRNIIY